MAERVKIGTGEIMKRLRARFAPPAYGLITEVGDGTGARQNRWADALAMSVWPSRGLELIGFEVKASRSDWVRERDNPAKAEAIMKYCDRWYLAVGDEQIVQPGELPATWGLLVPYRDALKCRVEAPRLKPRPIDRTFLASVFRRIEEQSIDKRLLNEKFEEGRQAAYKAAESSVRWKLDRFDKLAKKVQEFENASGVSLQHDFRSGTKIGEAVRRVLNGDLDGHKDKLVHLKTTAERMLESISRELSALEHCLAEIPVTQSPKS